jgi:gliding motility-associated protein GldL|tara:strand:+ start:12799 stop:13446 length:648 start_codon:yes stop_codon:yes gene_type:complete
MGIKEIANKPAFKTFMARLYGWGASLVILGALFKIQHWTGAGLFLTIGLVTEAIIFFFSAFESPKEEPDWSLVYPELAYMKDPDKKGTPSQQLDKALERAKIEDELIESLGEGLKKFGETATKLNETVESAAAISEYNQQIEEGVKNMNALNSLYELQLQTSSQQMEASTQFLQNLSTSIEDSKRFQQEVGKLAENLSSLNEVYANMLNAMNPNK